MSNRQAMPTCRPMSGSQGDRVRRIMDITRALLLQSGYKRTTIDEIARKADIGKGTVYLSWDTKDDLIRSLVIHDIIDVCDDVSNWA
jgi:AcrR family transcriptional regulator